MMTTVYEKTKKLNKLAEGYLEGKLQTSEYDAPEDGSDETTKADMSEQKIALNTSKVALNVSKDSVKVGFINFDYPVIAAVILD